MSRWLKILVSIVLLVLLLVLGTIAAYVIIPASNYPCDSSGSSVAVNDTPLKLSQHLLLAVRTGKPAAPIVEQLRLLDQDSLTRALASEHEKRAFWVNIYNGFVQILLARDTSALTDWGSRLKFFSNRSICVSGNMLSLNDIEHGMLRHSKVWWSKGYLNAWFPNGFEKRMRVPLDERIHFALNCGAASCPAIAFYNATRLDEQLDAAVRSYLQVDLVYDREKNEVRITEVFDWYRGDFGGKDGIVRFLKKYGMIPAEASPAVVFAPYDWSVLLSHFQDDVVPSDTGNSSNSNQ